MRRLIAILLVLLALNAVQAASGYDVVTEPPVPGMLALGTTFPLNVLDAQTGQTVQRIARIDAYVRWNQPIRPPEYYVVLTDVPGAFFILNRETTGL